MQKVPSKDEFYHLKPQSGLWKHIMSWWNRNKKHKSGLFQRDETLERPPQQWWFVPSPPLRATDRKRSPGQEGKGLLCIIVQIWEMFASQLFTWYLQFMIVHGLKYLPSKSMETAVWLGWKTTFFKLMIQVEPFIQQRDLLLGKQLHQHLKSMVANKQRTSLSWVRLDS